MFGCKPVVVLVFVSLALCQGCHTEDAGKHTTWEPVPDADKRSSASLSDPGQENKKAKTDRISGSMTTNQNVDRISILAFKKLRGDELRKEYGAHSLGIGWQSVDGKKTNKLALVFYVVSASSELASSIPTAFEYTPEGENVSISIPTSVVETALPVEE